MMRHRDYTGPYNRTVWSWAFYDFANSAYALLISGVAFQIYFKKLIFHADQQNADLAWGAVVSGSILLSALLSPFLGAASDASRAARKHLFVLFTLMAVLSTGSLAAAGPGSVVLGMSLFFLANFSFNTAVFLYDAYLPSITTEQRVGRVSGLGWGLGYVGGLACLLLTYPMFSREPLIGHSTPSRIGFLLVAAFFLIFSLPALRRLPGRGPVGDESVPLRVLARRSYTTSWHTLREWRQYREIAKFLIAYYFVTEAVITTIYFSANYLSSTFGFAMKEILLFTIVIQLIAFPASWLSGYFGDRWNLKRAFLVTTGVWCIIIMIYYFATSRLHLYVSFVLMGLVIGSTQALGRAFLANLAPREKRTEIFGFNSLSSKVAATLGPILFGVISSATGSQRLAWLSLLPFLLVGGVLILIVRESPADQRESAPQ